MHFAWIVVIFVILIKLWSSAGVLGPFALQIIYQHIKKLSYFIHKEEAGPP